MTTPAAPIPPVAPLLPNAPEVSMTADGWVWWALGLLLVLVAVRAWVVETGHATLGRTPVKVTVLTVTCGLVAAVVAGLVTVNGGARLVYLVAHPEEAQALEDAVNAANDTTAPVTPDPAAAAVPPSTPVPTPTTTPAPPPPAPRATTTRARPTARVARPPVRTTAPVAPPATSSPSTSTKATATRGDTARGARQQDATSTPPSTSRASR